MEHQIKSNGLACCIDQQQRSFKTWVPRTEMLILFIGFACTVCGKMLIIQRQNLSDAFSQMAYLVLPDALFFACIVLLICFLYLLKPLAFTARAVLLIAGLISIWSLLDLGWLMKSGVQLQPKIVALMIRDFAELWPLIRTHLASSFMHFALMGMVVFISGSFFMWKFIRPTNVITSRTHHIKRIAAITLVAIALTLFKLIMPLNADVGFTSEVLGFSSHWRALASCVTNNSKMRPCDVEKRNLHLSGQREIICSENMSRDLPNIVLVLLESVPYSETSLANAEIETTPQLARLASEGVEFQMTRVPVTHTTKAVWATLTSTTPVIKDDYVEAVPVEKTYEGLPTILKRFGYRSAYFKMAKGSYECAPSLINNLGFDFGWFRENLQDSGAHLGYLAGDDLRMTEPAFDWVSSSSQPFFLMMLTSVTHDPYELPGESMSSNESPREKYLKTLRYTDSFLKQVCEKLKEKGLEKDTILCVLGDHGTSFRVEAGEHGRWIPYEEVIRVPWVIRWPGHITGGASVAWPCSQMDVTPTILNLIGFDISNAEFEGRNALVSCEKNRRLYFSSWYDKSPIGYVEGNKKLVYWPYIDKIFEYDLDTDPKELSPRIVSLDKAEQIKREIQEWQKNSQIWIDTHRCTDRLLFSHWQTFSSGRSAWAYYVP